MSAKIVKGESRGKRKLAFFGLGRAASCFRETKIVKGESRGKRKPAFFGLG